MIKYMGIRDWGPRLILNKLFWKKIEKISSPAYYDLYSRSNYFLFFSF